MVKTPLVSSKQRAITTVKVTATVWMHLNKISIIVEIARDRAIYKPIGMDWCG
jgi:hypothetical protein